MDHTNEQPAAEDVDAPEFVDESGDGYGDPRHDDPRNYRNEPPLGVGDVNEV